MSTNEDKGPVSYSQAQDSDITTPEEDNKKRSMAEGIISDLANQRNEIDSIKEMLKLLLDQQNQLATMVNKITTAINNPGQTVATNPTLQHNQGLNLESLSALGDVAEKVIGVWKTYKGGDTAPSFIDQTYINDQVKKSVMGNFEVGEALISNLKSKLVNKAVAAQVSDAMKETKHEPE